MCRDPMIRIILSLILVISIALSLDASKRPVTIGIVLDGPTFDQNKFIKIFQDEISGLLADEFIVHFPEDKVSLGNWRPADIQNSVDQLLNDDGVDIVLTLGLVSSDYLSNKSSLSKPAIGTFVLDMGIKDLAHSGGGSGVKNLNYLSIPYQFNRNIEAFSEIVDIHYLTILENSAVDEAIPEIRQHAQLIAKEMGLKVTLLKVSKSADEALSQIPEETDAVYLGMMSHLGEIEYQELIRGLNKRKLPSFSFMGEMDVNRGVMAGLERGDVFNRIARRVALNVQRILLGEDAGSLQVAVSIGQRLTINMKTAREIEFFPSFEILTEAKLIDEQVKIVERKLSLFEVMQDALNLNLELSADRLELKTERQNIERAYSNIRPQFSIEGNGILLDKDRAEASFGQVSERTVSGSATMTQILYSDPVFANISIQKLLHESNVYENENLELDVVQQAAVAYLNVLKMKAIEEIRKNNLKLVRRNLELALIRESIGAAGHAEVYRWEAEIASSRNSVIESNSIRNLAEMELNRLLNRPLEESFELEDVDPADHKYMISRLNRYTYDPWSFDIVRDFIVQRGLELSRDLAVLDVLIAAKEREIRSIKRSFWHPNVALQGNVTETLSEEGAGADAPSGGADDTDWSIGLSVAFPLYTGGGKRVDLRQANLELQLLMSRRIEVAEKIEQRIRSALHVAGASFAAIDLSQDGAEAANRTLETVSDAYAKGQVSILDLLDAQNAALVAEQVAASTLYDFMIDYIEVQRSYGQFDAFTTESEKVQFESELEKYFIDRRSDSSR